MAVLHLHCFVQAFSLVVASGPLSSCGARISHCGSFSYCRAHGSRACKLQWLPRISSVAEAAAETPAEEAPAKPKRTRKAAAPKAEGEAEA